MMTPWWSSEEGDVVLHLGDCLDVMRGMPDCSIDAVVTDPPYALADLTSAKVTATIGAWLAGDRSRVPGGKGFMSRSWDAFVPPPAVWDECMRVLKPGGHLLAFAAPRTADLMGMSIRLAGLEVRDSLHWIAGSGFPKSKTCLKPAHEPVILARKPLHGTLERNLALYGTGALNIDGCRVAHVSDADRAESEGKNRHAGSTRDLTAYDRAQDREMSGMTAAGFFGQFPPPADDAGWPADGAWCARHWAPAALLGANGVGAATELMAIFVREFVPPNVRSPAALSRQLAKAGRLCCKLGDQRMYELWRHWPPAAPGDHTPEAPEGTSKP